MTQETWDEWGSLIRDQECAECGAGLTIHTVPDRAAMALGCSANHDHHGFRQRTCLTEDYRRGEGVSVAIRDKIKAKMMVPAELHRSFNLLAHRFPDAIRDVAGAALFIRDCMRLGLDPLIQPAEAVPVLYNISIKDRNGKVTGTKPTIVMITTEDGALSMAARGCPDEYEGSPATMPLLEHLMTKFPERQLDELTQMAERTAKELCDDAKAWVWVALGKRRSSTTVNPVYGTFTHAERGKAAAAKKPAGDLPGNQARVRAVKRWVRETFPESREKMLELTRDVAQRTGGVPELDDYIDAEYHVITEHPDKKPTLISPPTGGPGQNISTKAARSTGTKKAETKVGESAERATHQGAGDTGKEPEPRSQRPVGWEQQAAGPSGADETTSVSVEEGPKMATPREGPAAAGPPLLKINWEELRESLRVIKWSDDTCLSWFGLPAGGDLQSVLPTLPREKVEHFIRDVQDRASRVQPNMFQ
jgi:hypothetical protein